MAEQLIVYGFDTSNNMKVRVALGYKGIPYEFRRIDPADRVELLRISGQPLTPVLVHQMGGGGTGGEGTAGGETGGDAAGCVLFDSAAILRYLDANFPDAPTLFGSERFEIYEIEWWETFARRELAEPMRIVLKVRLGGEEDPTAPERASAAFEEALGRLEEGLAEQDWLVGDRMTAADVSTAPVVYRVLHGGFFAVPELGARTQAWLERVMAYDRPPGG